MVKYWTETMCVAICGIAFLLSSTAAWARSTPEEISRLGVDLTPLGGEMKGNEDGTIPPWTGGITTQPASYRPGTHHPDPYSDDNVLFTITTDNVDQYADKLSVGHKAMLNAYNSFYMKVYPTRRSASVPQRIYNATRRIAATAELVDGGNGIRGAVIGIPFPIPKNGLEVIWNHVLHYKGEQITRKIAQAAPTSSGSYTLVQFFDETIFLYTQKGMTEDKLSNLNLLYIQKILAPARLAGSILLVRETLDQVKEPRSAWRYNTGQRRVRRAPDVSYDNPGTASDGMRTTDQFDMFNGATDRYDWKLLGKKEVFVPYNSYQLQSHKLKYRDILTPLHLNSEFCRYELHRVWVVEATLKAGVRHLYKRRTFYVDEDSWQILIVDAYDNRDQLWRVSEGHVINYYDQPMVWTNLEAHIDLPSGRYLVIGLVNESVMHKFKVKRGRGDFTPAALRREGRR